MVVNTIFKLINKAINTIVRKKHINIVVEDIMKQIIIEGQHRLKGTIRICGAKNSAVALLPAAILCDEEVKIDNVPSISDIDALSERIFRCKSNTSR